MEDTASVEAAVDIVRHVLLPVALCAVPAAGALLRCAVDELKVAVRRLPLLVPGDVYLPAPPLYCPQADWFTIDTDTEPPGSCANASTMDAAAEEEEFDAFGGIAGGMLERAVRRQAARLVMRFSIILQAARAGLAASSGMLQRLSRMMDAASKCGFDLLQEPFKLTPQLEMIRSAGCSSVSICECRTAREAASAPGCGSGTHGMHSRPMPTGTADAKNRVEEHHDKKADTGDDAEETECGDRIDDDECRVVEEALRDLMAIMWMFHVRDELSLSLRKSRALQQKHWQATTSKNKKKLKSYLIEWRSEVKASLQWCKRLLPFGAFLGYQSRLRELIISLVREQTGARGDAWFVDLLAECTWDLDDGWAADAHNKLETLLGEWQHHLCDITGTDPVPSAEDDRGNRDDGGGSSVSVNEVTTVSSLKMYYFEKCKNAQARNATRQNHTGCPFEADVFVTDGAENAPRRSAGRGRCDDDGAASRPFEFDPAYAGFLDVALPVMCNIRVEDDVSEANSAGIPLLACYASQLRRSCLATASDVSGGRRRDTDSIRHAVARHEAKEGNEELLHSTVRRAPDNSGRYEASTIDAASAVLPDRLRRSDGMGLFGFSRRRPKQTGKYPSTSAANESPPRTTTGTTGRLTRPRLAFVDRLLSQPAVAVDSRSTSDDGSTSSSALQRPSNGDFGDLVALVRWLHRWASFAPASPRKSAAGSRSSVSGGLHVGSNGSRMPFAHTGRPAIKLHASATAVLAACAMDAARQQATCCRAVASPKVAVTSTSELPHQKEAPSEAGRRRSPTGSTIGQRRRRLYVSKASDETVEVDRAAAAAVTRETGSSGRVSARFDLSVEGGDALAAGGVELQRCHQPSAGRGAALKRPGRLSRHTGGDVRPQQSPVAGSWPADVVAVTAAAADAGRAEQPQLPLPDGVSAAPSGVGLTVAAGDLSAQRGSVGSRGRRLSSDAGTISITSSLVTVSPNSEVSSSDRHSDDDDDASAVAAELMKGAALLPLATLSDVSDDTLTEPSSMPGLFRSSSVAANPFRADANLSPDSTFLRTGSAATTLWSSVSLPNMSSATSTGLTTAPDEAAGTAAALALEGGRRTAEAIAVLPPIRMNGIDAASSGRQQSANGFFAAPGSKPYFSTAAAASAAGAVAAAAPTLGASAKSVSRADASVATSLDGPQSVGRQLGAEATGLPSVGAPSADSQPAAAAAAAEAGTTGRPLDYADAAGLQDMFRKEVMRVVQMQQQNLLVVVEALSQASAAAQVSQATAVAQLSRASAVATLPSLVAVGSANMLTGGEAPASGSSISGGGSAPADERMTLSELAGPGNATRHAGLGRGVPLAGDLQLLRLQGTACDQDGSRQKTARQRWQQAVATLPLTMNDSERDARVPAVVTALAASIPLLRLNDDPMKITEQASDLPLLRFPFHQMGASGSAKEPHQPRQQQLEQHRGALAEAATERRHRKEAVRAGLAARMMEICSSAQQPHSQPLQLSVQPPLQSQQHAKQAHPGVASSTDGNVAPVPADWLLRLPSPNNAEIADIASDSEKKKAALDAGAARKPAPGSAAAVTEVQQLHSTRKRDKRRQAKAKVAVFADATGTPAGPRTSTAGTASDNRPDEASRQKQQQRLQPRSEIEQQQTAAPVEHGYVLTPGLMDAYLDKDMELGSAADTYARMQYRASVGIHPPALVKRDMGVMTDASPDEQQQQPLLPLTPAAALESRDAPGVVVITSAADVPVRNLAAAILDASTMRSSEAGAVQLLPASNAAAVGELVTADSWPTVFGDALSRGVRGGILAPDMVLGLRFAAPQAVLLEPAPGEASSQRTAHPPRSFVSVVDIDSSPLVGLRSVTAPSHEFVRGRQGSDRPLMVDTGTSPDDCLVDGPTAREVLRVVDSFAGIQYAAATGIRAVHDSDSVRSASVAALPSFEVPTGDSLAAVDNGAEQMDDQLMPPVQLMLANWLRPRRPVAPAADSGSTTALDVADQALDARQRARQAAAERLRAMSDQLSVLQQAADTIRGDYAQAISLVRTAETAASVSHPSAQRASLASVAGRLLAEQHIAERGRQPSLEAEGSASGRAAVSGRAASRGARELDVEHQPHVGADGFGSSAVDDESTEVLQSMRSAAARSPQQQHHKTSERSALKGASGHLGKSVSWSDVEPAADRGDLAVATSIAAGGDFDDELSSPESSSSVVSLPTTTTARANEGLSTVYDMINELVDDGLLHPSTIDLSATGSTYDRSEELDSWSAVLREAVSFRRNDANSRPADFDGWVNGDVASTVGRRPVRVTAEASAAASRAAFQRMKKKSGQLAPAAIARAPHTSGSVVGRGVARRPSTADDPVRGRSIDSRPKIATVADAFENQRPDGGATRDEPVQSAAAAAPSASRKLDRRTKARLDMQRQFHDERLRDATTLMQAMLDEQTPRVAAAAVHRTTSTVAPVARPTDEAGATGNRRRGHSAAFAAEYDTVAATVVPVPTSDWAVAVEADSSAQDLDGENAAVSGADTDADRRLRKARMIKKMLDNALLLSQSAPLSALPSPAKQSRSLKKKKPTQRTVSAELRAQQRLYGTKRVPGAYVPYQGKSPRQVAAEQRMHDEEEQRQRALRLERQAAAGSKSPKASSHGRTMKDVTRRGLSPRRVQHTPLTYVEQLQHISATSPRVARRGEAYARTNASAKLATSLGAKLIGANTHGAVAMRTQRTQLAPTGSATVPHARRVHREAADELSLDGGSETVLSSWSIDEDVQRILGIGTVHYSEDHATDDLYSAMSDSRQGSSVGAASSYIDWDGVDRIIADVGGSTAADSTVASTASLSLEQQ